MGPILGASNLLTAREITLPPDRLNPQPENNKGEKTDHRRAIKVDIPTTN